MTFGCVKRPNRTYDDGVPRLVERPFDSAPKTADNAPADSEEGEIGGWIG